jgi:hypothetical protein
LGMALDELQESDVVIYENGFSFIIDQQLYEISKPIRVDSEVVDDKEELSISCAITENYCPIAENPDTCTGYCSPTSLCFL